ncbi:MAG: PD40 domain-containing protein, partial [Sedimentisphaerales bacterium]|nr:PD40 domain-containing protein [Sedimentisphaerales bacterium]
MRKIVFLALVFGVLVPAVAQDTARLLRFPAIHEDRIVFTYAGNLYTVAAAGGVARRLTNDVGFEMFARFSPDGKWIAFTAQYDGNTEVYLMPADGGEPKRLTFTATLGRDDVSDRMGPNNIVMGWKGKSDRIVFRSRRTSFNSFQGGLYLVSPAGELPEELPLPRGGFCSFSPDDSRLAYNRIFREFRTWKRYRGGMADDIWIYNFKTKKTENITRHEAQDIIPMWHENTIYFLSDRGERKRMNLYAYDTQNRQTRRLTDFTEFDIKFPSLGKKAIVFENGGEIYRFDLADQTCRKVAITIREDGDLGRSGFQTVSDETTNFEIAPDGNRALFGARGDVFTVPAKHGAIRNLTQTPGVHERDSKWSPDGQWIAYISDASGEDEIYIRPQDGSGAARQITRGGQTYKYGFLWSPDSQKILWSDKRLRLRYVEIHSGAITEVDQAEAWEFRQFDWSPDSRWIVYARPEVDTLATIQLYSLERQESFPLTRGWYEASSPTFSSDGKFVFFVSNRDFKPLYSWTEWNHVYQDMARIYLITLAKQVESPFRPLSDEVEIKKPDKAPDELTPPAPDAAAPSPAKVKNKDKDTAPAAQKPKPKKQKTPRPQGDQTPEKDTVKAKDKAKDKPKEKVKKKTPDPAAKKKPAKAPKEDAAKKKVNKKKDAAAPAES